MARAYSHQHFAEAPSGWRVRSRRTGDHVLLIAFPPGRRRRGSGRLLEILHPKRNPACENGECSIAQNPVEELLIFGNPSRHRIANTQGGNASHKPGCKCPICEHGRENPIDPKAFEEGRKAGHADAYIGNDQLLRLTQSMTGSSNAYSRDYARGYVKGFREGRRRNQSDTSEAVRLFETFHGHDPKEISERQETSAMRLDYTCLGDLDYLIVQPEGRRSVQINFDGDHVKLASAPNGRQLYLIGGNQNLSSVIGDLTDDPTKDFIDLGEGLEVEYMARKIHGHFEPTFYYHKFGEKNGVLPRLMYDNLKKRIFFVGGEYFIDTSQAVSPGIEN